MANWWEKKSAYIVAAAVCERTDDENDPAAPKKQ